MLLMKKGAHRAARQTGLECHVLAGVREEHTHAHMHHIPFVLPACMHM